MWTLRIILIVVGIVCLLALYWYLRRHPPAQERDRNAAPRVDPEWRMAGDEKHMPSLSKPASEPWLEQPTQTPPRPKKSSSRPAVDDKAGKESTVAKPVPPSTTVAEEIFMLSVRLGEEGLPAGKILPVLCRLDCRPGEDGTYRCVDAHGDALYNVASLFEPGVLHPLPDAQCLRGLAFFFVSPAERDDAKRFDQMLGAARDAARTLGGTVQDSQHRALTAARVLELKLAASRHG